MARHRRRRLFRATAVHRRHDPPALLAADAGTLRRMPWETADEIFAEQHNVASRDQLLSVLTAHQVDGMVRHGRLIACHRAVYHRAGVSLCNRGEAMAALLRCPEGAAITGPLVLGALGVDGFSDTSSFEVLLPPGSRVRGAGFTSRPNPSATATRNLGKLRLAAPVRALVDCGRPVFDVSDDVLWTAYDSARWKNVLSTGRFLSELAGSSRRDAGAVRWRRLADERLLRLESPKERSLDELMRTFAPPPEVQVWVTPARRVDFFWRRIRLAVEYLGAKDHAYREARQRDGARDDELERVGIRSVFVINDDLKDPEALAAWLLAVAERRAQELGIDARMRRG